MNDCKACGGVFSCGGNAADCLHPEGAAAVVAAQSQNPPQLPASKEVAGGPITPRVDHRPRAIDTLTGTACVPDLRPEYADGWTLAFADELGCLDAPGKLPAGSVLSYNGRLLPRMEWR